MTGNLIAGSGCGCSCGGMREEVETGDRGRLWSRGAVGFGTRAAGSLPLHSWSERRGGRGVSPAARSLPLETLGQTLSYWGSGKVMSPLTMSSMDLIRGTLDLLVLKTLSWGPMHGLGVLRAIEGATGERLQIEEGALYPALHRMEERGWLAADWGYSERGRRAKFYRLTREGRRQLVAESSRWQRYTEAVAMVLNAEGAR